MAISFKSVREKAQRLKEDGKEQIIPYQTEHLRDLKPVQRQVFSLFIKSKEVAVSEIAMYLGVKPRSVQDLVKKWLESGFVQIAEQSKKSRTYSLSPKWEQLISKK